MAAAQPLRTRAAQPSFFSAGSAAGPAQTAVGAALPAALKIKEPPMTEFIVPSLLNLLDPFNIVLMILGLAGGIIIGRCRGFPPPWAWPSWCR